VLDIYIVSYVILHIYLHLGLAHIFFIINTVSYVCFLHKAN